MLLWSLCFCYCFFFKQKTAYELRISDWSSDVCSSDLYNAGPGRYAAYAAGHGSLPTETHVYLASVTGNAVPAARLAAKPSTVPVNTLFAVQRDQGARSSVSALPALFVVQHDVGDKGEKATTELP